MSGRFPSDEKVHDAATLLRDARFKLAEDDPDLARDEDYLDDLFASDPNTIDAWEVLHSVMRASVYSRVTAKAAKEMAEKVLARSKRYETRSERLKRVAVEAIRLMGRTKANFPDVALNISAGRKRVRIIDEDAIPLEFKSARIEINRADIHEAIKSGRVVPGAALEDGDEVVTLG